MFYNNRYIDRRVRMLNLFSKLVFYSCYYLGAVKVIYLDRYFIFKFNWYHPLTWIVLIFLHAPAAYLGLINRSLFPIKMNEEWAIRNTKTTTRLVWL